MTDQRGRAARWNTALVLVPGTAAVFGAAVWWASDSTPQIASATAVRASAIPAATRSADPEAAALRHRLDQRLAAHRKHTALLQHRLAVLRARTARLEHSGSGAAVTASGGGSGGYPGSGAGPSGGGQVATPPPAPQPVAAPPPPVVHTNTGASGAP
jgi:hypothetical protein